MRIVEEHQTPDGLLTFLVWEEQGDTTLGFRGYQWHTHADILSECNGLPADVAIRRFVDALVRGEAVIQIVRVDGVIRDAAVLEADGSRIDKYKPDNETHEFRHWDGTAA